MTTEKRIALLSWKDASKRLGSGTASILPVGAGAKQHGFHLPLGTDQIQAEFFASKLAEFMDGLVWPTVVYGHYPAFTRYAGNSSLSQSTFGRVIGELASAILEQANGPLIVLNTGVSTSAPIAAAIAQLNEGARVRRIDIYTGPKFCAAVRDFASQDHCAHADEVETSIMLALAPSLVDMALATGPPLSSNIGAGPLSPVDDGSPNLAPSGSLGRPELASAKKGGLFVQAILDDLFAMKFES
ncbi:MAG: creatininase family protein [Alphaproteobacteria bacterium]|nr:creatininase family protein [Alphaproteobacteria bacterium]